MPVRTKPTGQGWRCTEDGCPTKGSWQFPLPPMTPREAFERHHRTNHSDTGRRP